MADSTLQSVAKTASNVSSAVDYEKFAIDVLTLLIPFLFKWFSQEKNTPKVIVHAIPTPDADQVVTDAILSGVGAPTGVK